MNGPHKVSRRRCLIRIIGGVLLVSAAHARAAEVSGIRFPETINLSGHLLTLNGAGLRSRAVFKIYAIGLYLSERTVAAADILSRPGPKRVTLALLRDITARQLTDALIEGIRDNHSPAHVERFLPRMERLAGVMSAVGAARNGSQITLDYLPGTGTRVALDGEQKGEAIEGDDFYHALLRIWLGDHPPDASLKDALLGRAR